MKNFVRRKEDFICEACGKKVTGDGYTDHCPGCLWGKHMDEETPGDRASECRGMMEPIEAKYEKNLFKIHYKCKNCGHEFWVREGKNDDREKMINLL